MRTTATGIDFDTVLPVYEGGCDSLACVTQDDGQGSLVSEVAWKTQGGARYYILVASVGSTSGEYTRSVAVGTSVFWWIL